MSPVNTGFCVALQSTPKAIYSYTHKRIYNVHWCNCQPCYVHLLLQFGNSRLSQMNILSTYYFTYLNNKYNK